MSEKIVQPNQEGIKGADFCVNVAANIRPFINHQTGLSMRFWLMSKHGTCRPEAMTE